jgi:RHS repeat-associated protein
LDTAAAALTYVYDRSDNRVLKTARDAQANEVHTAYVFDSLELRRARFDGTEFEQSVWSEVPYLSAHGVRLGRVHYATNDVPTATSGSVHVLLELADHLGSSAIVLDAATSELVESSSYLAHGGPESDYRPARWDSYREDYRFTGKENDAEVGLTYFGKRYAMPAAGRWISADPLAIHSLGADDNAYAYVRGAVLRAVDPTGLDAITYTSGSTVTVTSTLHVQASDGGKVEEKDVTALQAELNRVYTDQTVDVDGKNYTVHFHMTVRAYTGESDVRLGDNIVRLNPNGDFDSTATRGNVVDLARAHIGEGKNTFAHEVGHLLGLADLYARRYDRSRVTNARGKLDVSLDPKHLGQSWTDLVEGIHNLMGDQTAALDKYQLEEIAGPAVRDRAAGRSGAVLLDSAERVPGAAKAARWRDYRAWAGFPPNVQWANPYNALRGTDKERTEIGRFLNGQSDWCTGGAEYEHDGPILKAQWKQLKPRPAPTGP